MRILGIDTSLRATGYGLLDKDGQRLRPVAWGVIRNAPELSPATCLLRIHQGLRDLTAQYAPDCAAVENIFYFRNALTALRLGEARGVAVLTMKLAVAEVFGYDSRRVKLAVVGRGAARKEQVQTMVRHILGLHGAELTADSADALAIAICHAFHAGSPVPAGEKL